MTCRSYPFVRVTADGSFATVTANRPDCGNLLNPAMVHQLRQVFDCLANDPGVRGIILRGEGRAFGLGADLAFFRRNLEAGSVDRLVAFTRAGQELTRRISGCGKPVVARLDGPALGGSLELALACHHILAAPGVIVGFPETGLGLIPGLGGTQRTPRRVGVGLAKWLILTGKLLAATDAEAIGLVDQVVAADALDAAARQWMASGARPLERRVLPERFALLETWFGRYGVDQLRDGRTQLEADSGVVRIVRLLANKPLDILQVAERLIQQGMNRSLEEGLQMEFHESCRIFRSRACLDNLPLF